jgi:hypothetical protein
LEARLLILVVIIVAHTDDVVLVLLIGHVTGGTGDETMVEVETGISAGVRRGVMGLAVEFGNERRVMGFAEEEVCPNDMAGRRM